MNYARNPLRLNATAKRLFMTVSPYDDLISVIIPTYNRANRIGKAVESVLGQDYGNIELIVVDDGSTDETEAVLGNYPTIKIIRQARQGQGAARQAGLNLASGSYIASLDSDDYWNADFVSQSLMALKHSGATFAFANWITCNPSGQVIREESLGKMTRTNTGHSAPLGNWVALDHGATREIFCQCCPAPSSSFLVDRAYIVGGWRTIFKAADDWAFLLDIIMNDPDSRCVFTLEPLWTKQIDGTNIYDMHIDSVGLAEKITYDLELLLDLHGQRLTEKERKGLQKRLLETRVDLAYAQSVRKGQRKHAFVNALIFFREQPVRFTEALMRRCLAKCLRYFSGCA